ncbi:MAG TPA: transposase [Streptosporangiaceae bacterium]|nr:transposase [Streptosporangiaceae bacterium]
MTRQLQVSAGGVYGLGYWVYWAKYWRPVAGGLVADRCEELIGAKAAGRSWRMMALQIMADRVYLLMKAHWSDSPSPAAGQFTRFRSLYLRAEFAYLRSRLPTWWARSYVAAPAGAVPAQTACRYTGKQNERPWRKERAR